MKSLCSTMLLLFVLPVSLTGFAQQAATKPVLSASPDAPAPPTPVAPTPNVPSEPVPSHPVEVSPQYVIGPEDGIQVTVWKEPTLSGSFPVRPDGMISLALVGDIPAAGLTPMQLSADISTRLKKFINDPTVSVSVLAVNSKRIFLLGEVGRVGPMPLTPAMTVLQAISAAGGLSPYANAKHIYILRGEQGKQQKIPFNYKKAVKDGNQQGVSLLSGDTIVVP